MNKHIIITLSALMLGLWSCNNHSAHWATLNDVDNYIEACPDSAIHILESIDRTELSGREERAKFALLYSMALDKNYIDTTTFDVLQPAIDYYPEHGTPDEKLRTYYYQGRICQNKGDHNGALDAFTKGIDLVLQISDSLVLARTYFAQSQEYYELYNFTDYIENNIAAANVYERFDYKNQEYVYDCLLNALNGCVVLSDKERADSLINVCLSLPLNNVQNSRLQGSRLTLAMNFGTIDEIKELIATQEDNLMYGTRSIMTLALAYSESGKHTKAKELLHAINNCGIEYDTIKYLSIYVHVLENMGDYKGALSAYYDFSYLTDTRDLLKFENNIKLLNEKHNLELKSQKDAEVKKRLIGSCICGTIIFILAIIILLLIMRRNRIQKDLAVQKAKNIELENENLKYERDNKALEIENLLHRVDSLENERESLSKLINTTDSQQELPPEVQKAIKRRIEILNSLFANYITGDNHIETSIYELIRSTTDNVSDFMNNTRMAFQVSHPRFIQYLETHNLNTNEINYVCLYAIGLRGKDVGSYIKKSSHINISSAVRKKLGLEKHDTNLDKYIKNLLKKL